MNVTIITRKITGNVSDYHNRGTNHRSTGNLGKKKGIMLMVVTRVVIKVCRFVSTTTLAFDSLEPNLDFLSRFE